MYAVISGHNYINEIQATAQVFFPNEPFTQVRAPAMTGLTVCSAYEKRGTSGGFRTALYENGRLINVVYTCAALCQTEKKLLFTPPPPIYGTIAIVPYNGDGNGFVGDGLARPVDGCVYSNEKNARMAAARGVFEVCRNRSQEVAPWGLLVGVRPTRIIRQMWAKNHTNSEVLTYLTNYYAVAPQKARFCIDTAHAAKEILKTSDDYISVYIGIPFCVSTCLYCSFSSYLAHKYEGLTDAYLDALMKELDYARSYIKNTKKPVQCVYIGGGTPTALSEARLNRLLSAISATFESVTEFTVEAGRPDTITKEKLGIMQAHGVSRVSINPQTLNDATLTRIGRAHTAADFYKAYEAAAGRFTVNTDIIFGLPGENAADVSATLAGVIALKPQNITVHTLCVKRASRLKNELIRACLPPSGEVSVIADEACVSLYANGYLPYYMYRQKNTIGNLENAGYSLPGYECLYNIQITEERQSILGIGAGAVTKYYEPKKDLLRRVYNPKTPEEYIKRMMERKNNHYERIT